MESPISQRHNILIHHKPNKETERKKIYTSGRQGSVFLARKFDLEAQEQKQQHGVPQA